MMPQIQEDISMLSVDTNDTKITLDTCCQENNSTITTAIRKNLNRFLWICLLISGTFIYGTYSILVHVCEVDGKLPFDPVSLVLMIEVLKLLMSLVMFLSSKSYTTVKIPQLELWLLFAIPSVLYAVNNNLSFYMQGHMDPTTYQLLSNLKIGSTAILYRFIMKRPLSNLQWTAIVSLTMGGVLNSYGSFSSRVFDKSGLMYIDTSGLLMVVLYCLISGLSGVYSEFIIKQNAEVPIHLQNIMFYVSGVLLNFVAWSYKEYTTIDVNDAKYSLFKGFTTVTFLILVTQAVNGLIMACVMKFASNITRLFIISCATFINAVLSVLLFGAVLNIYYIISAFLILTSIFMYNK